ncbi:MAG: signal peptide peptidase SppA [Alphaproteobacteria bacterium]|nr:signal peptide peptidase SppA [Alphaproteobacteria bacterium]
MKKIVIRIFAAIGLLATGLVITAGFIAANLRHAPAPEPEKIVLALDFNKPLVEQESSGPLDFAVREQETVLQDVVRALDRARKDPRVLGVVARFGANLPPMAQAQEIMAALRRFRESGKFSYAFAPSFGEFSSGSRAYYLASAFEQIWLQPVGIVGLTGLRAEVPFAKTALADIGVRANFMQREEYKNAMESLTRDDFSEPARAMMQALMQDVAQQMAEGVAAGRGLGLKDAQWLIENGPYTAEAALQLKLVDKIGYTDELDALIDSEYGDDAAFVSPAQYIGFAHQSEEPKAKVALVHADGMIVQGGGPAGRFGGGIAGSEEIARAIALAGEDENVQAIIFRIDSPGGSPIAAETIRRAVVRAKEKGKVVVVSMANVAGSGGYWIAMNADYIVAQPGTLTGSIGVVGGKYVTEDMWKKLGINWGILQQGEHGGMWSFLSDYTPAEQERANMLIDDIYKNFVDHVAEARKIPPERMSDVAKGRVFTGAQALKNGLVDELGGFDTAMQYVRAKLALAADAPVLVQPFPKPLSPAERIMKIIEQINKQVGAVGAMSDVAVRLDRAMQVFTGVFSPGLAARMPASVEVY